MLFVDASALVKLYLPEEGSENMQGVLSRGVGRLFISDFVALEVLTSLRSRLRKLKDSKFQKIIARFWAQYPHMSKVEVDERVRSSALRMTVAYRQQRARSLDVLHLATALRLQDAPTSRGSTVTLITSDRDLAALAEECGLRTFDPSVEPLAALPRAPRR